jgi:hypothetical protein
VDEHADAVHRRDTALARGRDERRHERFVHEVDDELTGRQPLRIEGQGVAPVSLSFFMITWGLLIDSS